MKELPAGIFLLKAVISLEAGPTASVLFFFLLPPFLPFLFFYFKAWTLFPKFLL
jgi:hypothetical protein